LAVAEGQAGNGFAEAAAHGGASALGAEPIGMDEISSAVRVGGDVAVAGVHFTAVPPAARIDFRDLVSSEVVQLFVQPLLTPAKT
jgi:hypothetical protein